MLRLVDRLSIEFKGELGMARLYDVRIEILVAGYAGIRAHVEASQIAHLGCDTHRISPIFSGMPSQPRLGCAVTTFAGDAFVRVRCRQQPRRRHRLKWGMTNRTTAALLCCR